MTDQAVLDFYRVAEQAESKHNTNADLEYWQQQADNLALSQHKPMAVVNMGGVYQVWPATIVNKSYEILYQTGGGTCS
ncbi:MAG: hypothetical protein K0R55_4647 [Sporomusa sp.]|jgi:hypothetical protein|nr:hypothetical protein [Sporomusa sp.]